MIVVERFVSDKDSTVGLLFVNALFQCFTLEDQYREEKIQGETRIPAGTYDVVVKKFGGFHKRYEAKFPDLHRGMLEIERVEGFTDILIHVGNWHTNTDGCLLVGEGASCSDGDKSIQASVNAYKKFYANVIDEAEAGSLRIMIVDRDTTFSFTRG